MKLNKFLLTDGSPTLMIMLKNKKVIAPIRDVINSSKRFHQLV